MNTDTEELLGPDGLSGFAPSPPLHLVGAAVSRRDEHQLRSRRNWDELPLLAEAVEGIAEHVRSEHRFDETMPVNALSMREDGQIVFDGEPIAVELSAFRQLCQRAGIPGGSMYLSSCPPPLRATNLNHWLPRAEGDVKLRQRRPNSHTSLYAVVSPSYAAYDTPDLLLEAAGMIADTARIEASYDGLHLRFRAILEVDVPVSEVGDVFKAGIEIASADDGTGALKIASVLWRALCLNLMVFSLKRRATVRRVHRGVEVDMAAALFVGIREAKAAIGPFTDLWSRARQERVADSGNDRLPLLERLFEHKLLQTPGIRASEAVNAIRLAWDLEYDLTRAGLVNAVSRAAHEFPWPSVAVAEGLELQAGHLLTARLPS